MKKILQYLTKPQNAVNLALIRIGFGVIMCLQFISFLFQYLKNGFFNGPYRIPYHHLEFIRPLPEAGLEALLYLGMAASILVIVGLAARMGFITMGLVWAYFFFLDKTVYNNHYYLFILLCFLMACTQSDARLSLKSRRSKSYRSIPQWQYLIIGLQVFIVYFFGGLAKMNAEWLSGDVTRDFIVGLFTENENVLLYSKIFAWCGMLFDLSIGFLLFWKKTRKLAFAGVIMFNLTNGLVIFQDIGLFPYAMLILSILPFADRNWIDKNILSRFRKKTRVRKVKPVSFQLQPLFISFFCLYFFFQFTYPLRHYFISGNPDWTGVGANFSWRMKNCTKIIELKYYAYDRASGKLIAPITDLEMTDYMKYRIGIYPYNVWYVGQKINAYYQAVGRDDIRVSVDYRVAMNWKKMQEVTSLSTDIGRVDYCSWSKNGWVQDWKRKVADLENKFYGSK